MANEKIDKVNLEMSESNSHQPSVDEGGEVRVVLTFSYSIPLIYFLSMQFHISTNFLYYATPTTSTKLLQQQQPQ